MGFDKAKLIEHIKELHEASSTMSYIRGELEVIKEIYEKIKI